MCGCEFSTLVWIFDAPVVGRCSGRGGGGGPISVAVYAVSVRELPAPPQTTYYTAYYWVLARALLH